jgi:hypothetical protein
MLKSPVGTLDRTREDQAGRAVGLFSGAIPVTPQRVICKIDNLLATRTNEQDQAAAQNARRQAIIDDLLRGAHGPATAATAAVATAE